jgi:hypothetical protein
MYVLVLCKVKQVAHRHPVMGKVWAKLGGNAHRSVKLTHVRNGDMHFG